ncbi:ABC transporter, ATPase, putative [Nannochloropsis gaditana]|uniref:ABC transporter, ATPase, putative n=1 Tax=Nannochloropsis gaditana TaxID=72520 RepID=W7T242_9STRA|nr:ABC transporter, ATPase, putative [Nannochloropsis gaditana]
MDAATALPFQSPPTLEREVTLPNAGKLKGMGIPKGITLIVGGGFHGKSTLLQALELGIHNHIPGDGREFVCVDPSAVKVRAEDGRAVTEVNITPFIDNLPFGKRTDSFCTADASGSTSQAASIIEALEVGAQVLLMDEDTCATNFMIRDLRMQLLVSKDKEPITPFLAKVQALYTQHGISSLLVIGGAGDYFEVADTVIMMDNYTPLDKTVAAKAIADQYSSSAGTSFFAPHFGTLSRRLPVPASLRTEGKVVARGKDKLQYGEEDVDLSGVEQLVEKRSFAVIRGVTCKCGKAKKEMDVDGRDSQMKVVSRVQDVNHLEPIARFVLPFQPLLHSSQSFYPSYGIWPRVFMGMDFIEACLTSSLACCPDICGLVSIASIVPLSSSYLGASAGSDTIKRKMSKVRRSRAIRMLQESRR